MNFIDVNGIEYKQCPRCQGEWSLIHNHLYYCIKCFMFIQGNTNKIISYTFKNIHGYCAIYWEKERCKILTYDSRHDAFIESILPILPFDISFDKLKTYLLFL